MLGDWVTTVLTSATAAALLTGLAITLFKDLLTERLKGVIKSEYDAKLESHKAQLQSSNAKELEVLKVQLKAHADVELEQLKSQLQLQTAQQSLTFSRLHEKRVEAIASVHQSLLPVRDAVEAYIAAFQPVGSSDEANLQNVQTSYTEFKSIFARHQIFLPRDIASAVSGLDRTFVQVTNQFTLVVKARPTNPQTDLWIKLVERFQTDANETIAKLQEDMRTALGDSPADAAG